MTENKNNTDFLDNLIALLQSFRNEDTKYYKSAKGLGVVYYKMVTANFNREGIVTFTGHAINKLYLESTTEYSYSEILPRYQQTIGLNELTLSSKEEFDKIVQENIDKLNSLK